MRGTLSLAAVMAAGLVVVPAASAAEPVNLAGPGFVGVTVADGVDPVSLRLAGQDPLVTSRDVSGTTVLHFDAQALPITAATTSLPLTGRRDDGAPYAAAEAIAPTVLLEVKTTDAAALRARFPDAQVESLVPQLPAAALAQLAATAKTRSGHAAPEMRDWYRVTLPADVDIDATLAPLRSLHGVEHADPAPDAAPPPATPDFTSMQTYQRPAPIGTDMDFSRADSRSRGAGVRIVDLEYYWTSAHEDLQLTAANDLGGAAFPQYTTFGDEHGTAVFGEMAALDNGFGVTGGVPDVGMYGISPTQARANGGTSYVPAAALTTLAGKLSPGDVVLIEQQTVGPNGGTAYVPLEWTQSGFDALKLLNGLGIVVVETGGNGGENLDAASMLGRFDRGVRDSGAILVGAGSSTDHAPLSFSSWGSRVDLQGFGQNVTTTGSGGNLFGGNSPASVNFRYTRSFSGTSSAGPVVASAVAAVQSYLKATGQGPWTATQISDLLKATGTPQGGDPAHRVGPLPNTAAALKRIEVDAPTSTASFASDGTVTLTADDGWGAGVARIEYRADGGAWTPYGGPFKPAAGTHVLEHRAFDRNGNAEVAASITLATDTTASVSGAVGATLVLTVGPAASFGAFQPGVDRQYAASTTATVTSSAGEATLSVAEPGRLANGPFTLAQPVQVAGLPKRWTGPVSNDTFTIDFKQAIGAAEALRTGAYSTTLTFTLSTTMP